MGWLSYHRPKSETDRAHFERELATSADCEIVQCPNEPVVATVGPINRSHAGPARSGVPTEFDPDAAMDAYYAAREAEPDRELDEIVTASLDAQPDDKIVQFMYDGQRCWAIRTSQDEYVVRADYEFNPAEFPGIERT